MRDSRADALGQILVIELKEHRWNVAGERLMRARQPGGVLLSGRNLRIPGHTAELLHGIARTLTVAPFLALEEEGGLVDPLHAFFPPLPSPRAVAEKSPAAAARLGELVGAGLKLLGFNTNLAPLLDLCAPHYGSILGTRSFSADAATVAKCGRAFLGGLRHHRIIACGKYFPGLSAAAIDRHSKLPVIGKTMAELWREDLIPYRELLPQLPLVMVGHGAYKAYDFDLPCPATLSPKVVEGLLRTKLGYGGVAVADDLASEVIRRTIDLGEAAVRSVNAGCDLLLVGGGREECVEVILGTLKSSLDSGRLSARRLEQALKRIRHAKKRISLPTGRLAKSDFDRLARQFESFGKECKSEEPRSA